jgi:hypothetical protein
MTYVCAAAAGDITHQGRKNDLFGVQSGPQQGQGQHEVLLECGPLNVDQSPLDVELIVPSLDRQTSASHCQYIELSNNW